MDNIKKLVIKGQEIEVHDNGKDITQIFLNYPLVKVRLFDISGIIESEQACVYISDIVIDYVKKYARMRSLRI